MRFALVLALSTLTPIAALAEEAPSSAPAEKTEKAEPAADTEKAPEGDKVEEPADAEPAAPSPEQGSLSVSSAPAGAKIFIDGKDTGKTTPAVDLAVAPGTHELKVVLGKQEKAVTFHLEAGGVLSLNLNLPEATPAKGDGKEEGASSQPAEGDKAEGGEGDGKGEEAAVPADWTWMTVAGWSGLGLGTMGIVAGSVVLATQGDPDQGPLGFGLFGAGAGLILGGGVLLYLDEELGREEETEAVSFKGLEVLRTAPAR